MPLLFAFVIGFIAGIFWQRSRLSPSGSATSAPVMRDVTDHEIEELLRKGQKLAAIKRYREIHACDIATAQNRVDTLEAILKL